MNTKKLLLISISIIALALIAYNYAASNITGGVSESVWVAPTVSNLVYGMSDNTVYFDLSRPVTEVRIGNLRCDSAYPFTHWTCPRPAGTEMKLRIVP